MITDSFDNTTEPVVSLKDFYGERKHLVNTCLIIFSKEIYRNVIENHDCTKIAQISACNGEVPIYKFTHNGNELAFYLTAIGSTAAAQYCIEANWLTGARNFIMFGSCGSLNEEQTRGKFIIPTDAYRDEGMSYHYAPPCDYIQIKNSHKIKEVFDELNIPYTTGKVWTTDAFLRETVGQIAKRKSEGCIAVEMELAGVQSVCDFYGFELYDFLAAGDILSTEKYDVSGLKNANHNIDKLKVALVIAERLSE